MYIILFLKVVWNFHVCKLYSCLFVFLKHGGFIETKICLYSASKACIFSVEFSCEWLGCSYMRFQWALEAFINSADIRPIASFDMHFAFLDIDTG